MVAKPEKADIPKVPEPNAARAGVSARAASEPEKADISTIKVIPMLAVLIVAALTAAYNENAVSVALPQIMQEFTIDAVTAQWLVSAYMVVTACICTMSAFLYNRLGVRRLFYTAACFLGVGLAISVLAPNFACVLIGRLIQAVGTGISIPTVMSVTFLLAPEEKRGIYVSAGASVVTLGPALAPVIGGVLVTSFGWRTTMLVPLIVIVCAALAGISLVKNPQAPQDDKIDAPSIAIAAIGLFAFSYALSVITTQIALAIGCIVVFLACVALFARRQNRLETPLLSLAPIKNKSFRPSLALVTVDMLSTFTLGVVLPLYYQQACGLTADYAGLLLLVPLAFNVVTAFFSGMLYDKFGPWPVIPIGFIAIFAGQVIMALFAASGNYVAVLLASILPYAGVGISMPPVQTLGVSDLRPEEYPCGSALLQLFVMIAACAGPPLFIGIMSSAAAAQMSASVAAAGVAGAAASVAAAGVAGAAGGATAAASVGAGAGAGALEAAANAFGFSVTMVVALVISFFGMILALKYCYQHRRQN